MCDDGDCTVALQRRLPDEPKLFALIHELKHHYCDREALGAGVIHCGDYDANELIEKGAEEFAADLTRLNLSFREASDVVTLKQACKAKVSYKFICKRLERLGHIASAQF